MRHLLAWLGALAGLTGCASAPLATNPHLPNLALVSPGVWRGGQPDADGWQQLAAMGVTNVVKLNEVDEAPDKAPGSMAVHYRPIDLWHQLIEPPPLTTLSNAVALITPGTFVHCEHGQDRTGLVIACWRVWRCGWSKPAAEQEMLAHGFHKELQGMWEAWEDAPW